MEDTISTYLSELHEDIRLVHLEIDDPIKASENCITLTLKAIEKLKTHILKTDFKNRQEEIFFFKNTKPLFISKLIYYNRIYIMEANKPNGGEKILRKYYNNELGKLKQYFDDNIDFYKYYRTGNDYLDSKYFLRGKYDIKLSIDTFFFEADQKFSTSHDFKVAKIIANDLLQIFLIKAINSLEMQDLKNTGAFPQDEPKLVLKWTASKVAMTEILYGLHYLGAFNHGATELKEIAAYFEKVFNIELGDFYRTFLELRMRKKAKTKFIDKLRDTLHQKMDEYEI